MDTKATLSFSETVCPSFVIWRMIVSLRRNKIQEHNLENIEKLNINPFRLVSGMTALTQANDTQAQNDKLTLEGNDKYKFMLNHKLVHDFEL